VIFLSSRKSKHPRRAACYGKLCAPVSISDRPLYGRTLPILPLREKMLRNAAQKSSSEKQLRNSDFHFRCLFSMTPLPGAGAGPGMEAGDAGVVRQHGWRRRSAGQQQWRGIDSDPRHAPCCRRGRDAHA